MAWQYGAVCIFDFIIAPMMTMAYFKWAGGAYVPWVPLTLRESGFYHMAMMTILGVAAWTRGQEKLAKIESANTTTTQSK